MSGAEESVDRVVAHQVNSERLGKCRKPHQFQPAPRPPLVVIDVERCLICGGHVPAFAAQVYKLTLRKAMPMGQLMELTEMWARLGEMHR